MKKMRWLLLVAVMLLGLSGCVTKTETDPVTGQQTKYIRLDPNEASKYEGAADSAVGIAGALSLVFPFLAPIVTAAGGVLLAYKRLKPKLVASEAEKSNYYRGGEILALTLDIIKKDHPDVWVKISPTVSDAMKYGTPVENAIRGFRHLAPR